MRLNSATRLRLKDECDVYFGSRVSQSRECQSVSTQGSVRNEGLMQVQFIDRWCGVAFKALHLFLLAIMSSAALIPNNSLPFNIRQPPLYTEQQI